MYVAAALSLAFEVFLKSLTLDGLTFSLFFERAENILVDCLCSHHCRLLETIAVWGNRCISLTQHAQNQSLEMICLVLCIQNFPELKFFTSR